MILNALESILPLLTPIINGLEQDAINELKTIANQVQNTDLQGLLGALINAIDAFAKAEITKYT